MKQKIEGGWEQEFDNLTTKYYEFGKTFEEPLSIGEEDEVVIKDFIRQLLASERQRCVDSLPKKDKRKYGGKRGDLMSEIKRTARNEAIDQAKQNLEQLK